jgi:hypothetical protein
MHHPLRRAAGAAAIAVPGMASAFSSCGYDAATKRVTVSDGSGDDGRLQVTQSGQFVAIRDLPIAGAVTQPLQLCTNGSVSATVTNTDRVIVQGGSRGGLDDYVLSVMSPGATEELDGFSELEIQVQQLNNIGATLAIGGTPGNDTLKAGGTGSTLVHAGKTATAKLAVRLPDVTGSLRVDVDATDRDGRRKVEPGAGTIVMRRA